MESREFLPKSTFGPALLQLIRSVEFYTSRILHPAGHTQCCRIAESKRKCRGRYPSVRFPFSKSVDSHLRDPLGSARKRNAMEISSMYGCLCITYLRCPCAAYSCSVSHTYCASCLRKLPVQYLPALPMRCLLMLRVPYLAPYRPISVSLLCRCPDTQRAHMATECTCFLQYPPPPLLSASTKGSPR